METESSPLESPYEKVLLVAMPFQSRELAPLAVALLGTLLRQHGIAAQEAYLHFELAEILGRDLYRQLASSGPADPAGELLFARDEQRRASGPFSSPAAATDSRLVELFGDEDHQRRQLDLFSRSCLERVEASGASLIGFSVSFQVLPALWLARRIKERWPHIDIVFGGSACAEPMGHRLFHAYPEIDYVVSGFGEKPLLDLVYGRVADGRRLLEHPRGVALDELPIPEYDTFLEQAEPFVANRHELMLAFETSRGCWWGQKSHCTFCGLNQYEMAFNAKTSERAEQEIRTLWERYHTTLFATDTILSRVHQKEVLPRLASYPSKPTLFYEVKSNMREEEVRVLAEANVLSIQPGIESLHSRLLGLLKKGVTAIQNLAFLKWCREQGVYASWNLLCGIPGETSDDYREQIQLFSKIPHFVPPLWVSPIRIDRFSPYFERYREYGWSDLTPMKMYRQLHPQLNEEELMEIAYHFEARGGTLQVEEYLANLETAVTTWKERHRAGEGLYWDENNGLVRVEGKEATVYDRDDAMEAVLEESHRLTTVDRLLALPGVERTLIEEMIEEGVLYQEGRRLINLSLRGLQIDLAAAA